MDRVYVGESSRSSYERGGEHARDYATAAQDSHMHKHAETEHAGEDRPRFIFRVVKTFENALARQVSEAVGIRRRGDCTLNSKGVYNRCSLPRLVVEQQGKELHAQQQYHHANRNEVQHVPVTKLGVEQHEAEI